MITISTPIKRKLSENVWVAELDPSEVRLIGSSGNAYGALSVVVVSKLGHANGRLEFEHPDAHVVNVGTSSEALIISAGGSESTGGLSRNEASPVYTRGDQAFLDELPAGELKAIGSALLRGVRRNYQGALSFYPKSGRYVESPDNFWTVRIQRRDGSLRITVRGVPEDFEVPAGIDLKPDQRVYSNFKIWQRGQVDGALSIIRGARRK